MQRDGSLTVNDTKLNKAVDNLGELKKLFSNIDAVDPTKEGFARRFRAASDDMLGISGALSTRNDGLTSKLERNRDRQEALQTRLEQTQKRLEAQYTALDKQMGQLSGLSSYVTQQITQWNKA
jgi:flagellar hook-associated protein 2